MQFDNESDRGK